MPCTCEAHKNGAEIKIQGHQYRFEEAEGAQRWPMWRYRCSCGKTGIYQYQSDSVSYHQWLGHVHRATGFTRKPTTPPASRPA